MIYLKVVVLGAFLSTSCCVEDLTFPPWFKFGAATSAYQIEGGLNCSDVGENLWDRFIKEHPELILDRSNAKVTCDSYHLYTRDVEMLSELGVQIYRFSISWSRLLPSGYTDQISEDGKMYYNNLINELLRHGIQPMITIHHFDLPQSLQDLGGWTNPYVAELYSDYARVVFSLYADRVPLWLTINEPVILCDYTYNTGAQPPGVRDPDNAMYLCNKNTLIGHALAYRIYEREFKPKYHGKVSMCNFNIWFEAMYPEHEELTESVRQYGMGRFSHAIFSETGGWPPVVEKIIAENSKKQGLARSRLPAFTKEEIDLVKGTADFYAINHYSSRQVRGRGAGEYPGEWLTTGAPEMGAVFINKAGWQYGANTIFTNNPEGLRRQISWLRKQYGDLEFMITETGYMVVREDSSLNDDGRVGYMKGYLREVLKSVKEDGANITAYVVWSLMDNFEWSNGYQCLFGLYETDFSDPLRTRRPRKSAFYYKSVISNQSLDVPDPSDL